MEELQVLCKQVHSTRGEWVCMKVIGKYNTLFVRSKSGCITIDVGDGIANDDAWVEDENGKVLFNDPDGTKVLQWAIDHIIVDEDESTKEL